MIDRPSSSAGARRWDERGATAVEYALLAALIAGVIIGIVTVLGGNVFGLYDVANDTHW